LLLTTGLFAWLYRSADISLSVWPVISLALSQCLLSYLQVFIQSLYRYKAMFFLNLAAAITGIIFLVVAMPLWGAIAYVYVMLLINVILCTGYAIMIVGELSGIKNVEKTGEQEHLPLRGLITTSLFYAASAVLSGILWQRFEITLLKEYFGYEKVAVYGIAFTVMALFTEPLKMLPGVLTYYFAGIGDQSEKAAAQFGSYFRHFCWIVIFTGVFVWADARHIVTVLYTDKYLESVYYLRILLVGMIPGVCSYVLMNMHIGLGKARFLVIQDAIGAVVFLILFFAGNYFFELYGIAWAKSVAILICVALGLWYTGSRLKFSIPYRSISLSVLLSLVLLCPLAGLGSSSVVLLAIKGLVLFFAYVFVSRKLKIIDGELVDNIIQQIRRNIFGSIRF
jgi:O-antigen/teichoic acid export membrane protein